MANNTGQGGFDVDGQTYTFDTGLSEQDGGAQGPAKKEVDVSKSYVDASGKPKDLTTKTKTTLSQYLSKQTNGQSTTTPVPNRFPVDPGYNPTAITTKEGYPVIQTPGAPPVSNSQAFAPDPTEFTSYTHDYSKLTSGLKKGKAQTPSNVRDGNDVLPGVQGDASYIADPGKLSSSGPIGSKAVKGHPDTSGVVKPYVSAVLSVNRFAAAGTNTQKPYVDSTSFGEAGFNPTFLKQPRLGVYDSNATGYSAERMAAVGPLLTMRAGKELGAASPGANPNDGSVQAKAILPGLGQIGITRIDQQVLLASDVMATLTTDELKDVFVINPNALSWGQLNNVDDPFSGTDAVGMLALSTALVAGVELLIDALSVLLGVVTPSLKTPARDSQGRYSLGEYLPGSKQAKKSSSGGLGGAFSALSTLNFGALLGLQPTNYPFNRALTAGLNAFFGIPDSKGGGIGLNQLVGALTSSTDSPGFNVVVCRAIIRSSLTIVDKLKKIGGNVMNAITQVMSLIDTIRGSKIIAACNIFANLGDAILSNPDDFFDKDANKRSTMDAQDNVNAVSNNRIKGSLKLSWSSNRAPANLILPASVLATSLSVKDMGQFDAELGLRKDPYSYVKRTIAEERISTEDAVKFEETLESAYVPFYFHDLRTNEMIAFHAFLASITDDYTAAYDRADGFGRVEPVRIYKGTERKIGMSFYIVSTSALDMDEMYLKINKLVTLVYPQYTKGVQLSSKEGDYVFTQPFSQLVGASPLIRLRLGDLLRSNYTPFALGRLFGMGNKEFVLEGNIEDFSDITDDALQAYQNKFDELLKSPNGSAKFYPDSSKDYPYIDPKSVDGGVGFAVPPLPIPGSKDGPKFATKFKPGILAYQNAFVVKVKKIDPDSPFHVIGEVAINNDPEYMKKFPKAKKFLEKEHNNPDRPLYRFVGGTYRFAITDLMPTSETSAELAQKISGLQALSENSSYGQSLAKFLSPQNNAIAKSFADTGGKGLAGFIESMNFDWFDKVTWDIESGRVAPMMCKVSITFAPVHDISPGIDHVGFNRAPIYPVGAMKQKFIKPKK